MPSPKARDKNDTVDVYDDDGTLLGHITYNKTSCSLDGHCHIHKGARLPCKIDRTVNPASRGNKGRPKGLLIAWMKLARHESIPDGAAGRDAHFAAAKAPDPFAFLSSGSCPERQRGRAWATVNLAHFPERDQRPGEPEEPPGLP
jgi:hypothetical protein